MKLASLLVVSLAPFIAWGQLPKGAILGTVTDEKGAPVSQAQVSPQLSGFYIMHTLVRTVETDKHGQFRVDGLEWGSYVVYAGKRSEGYPDTRYPLYRTRPAPKIVLSPKHPTANAKVVIGPKAGVLVLSVRDAVTGHPIAPQLLLRKADGSGSMSITATPEVLIPANTDVHVEVREPGFKPWIYGKPSMHSLRLGSGERMMIDVRLTPSDKTAAGIPQLPDFARTSRDSAR